MIRAAIAAFASVLPSLASAGDLSVLHPLERPAFSEDWRTETRRTAAPGDMVLAILKLDGNPCVRLSASRPDIAFWQMLPLETETPSDEATATGTFHEVLAPRSAATCTLSRLVLAEWRAERNETVEIGGGHVRIEVRTIEPAAGPRLPFMVGINPANLLRGHCAGTACTDPSALYRNYAAMLRDHGLQPMQAYVKFPPIVDGRLDLDAGAGSGVSFRQTVMDQVIHGLVGFPRASRYPDPAAYLKALQRTVEIEGLKGRAWVYAADEPADLDALAETLGNYRRLAPDVRVLVTTDRDPRLEGLVDTYAPVFNRLVSGRHPGFGDYADIGLWTYLSCMGSCGPHRAEAPEAERSPGPATGIADLLIDRPARRLFRFFRQIDGRVDGLLYYEAIESYRLVPMGVDIFRDTWNFGGNGDGLLVFPGRPGEFGGSRHGPLPSLRLKFLRHALQSARARAQR
ncbi:MAG: hypothetical protein ACMVY4_10700 [Minwuia sp.]|uniref:hypothetical protein n=1 Tax=Minwuia sp. TaxID=2493630 RepID=UPI003A8B4ED8